jgi:hypothetical protein
MLGALRRQGLQAVMTVNGATDADLIIPLLMVGILVERHTRVDDVIMLSDDPLRMSRDHCAQLWLNLGMLSFDVDLHGHSPSLLRFALCAVLQLRDPLLAGTMGAAIHRAVCLDAVTDDAAATVCARRGQRLDGAFKAIERVRVTSLGDLKGFIVLVAAGFAPCHRNPLPPMVETLSSSSACALYERGKTYPGFNTELPGRNFYATHLFP